jgi:hypothetical protein
VPELHEDDILKGLVFPLLVGANFAIDGMNRAESGPDGGIGEVCKMKYQENIGGGERQARGRYL